MSSFIQVVDHIFGNDFLSPTEKAAGLRSLIGKLNDWLLALKGLSERSDDEKIITDSGNGRIGNKNVTFDLLGLPNRIMSSDSFKIIGVSHFGTVKTNCGVYKGKWQYEALLLSTGIMQIGWATSNSLFGSGRGVGDTADSYSYDGCRVCKWNVISEKYGEKWKEEDVIGCCIDLDDGCVEFFRNGKSMGVAFADIQMGAGVVYFPAVSLQQKAGLMANFGSRQFWYPVPGYNPIQEPPIQELTLVSRLLEYIGKLLPMMDRQAAATDTLCDGFMSTEAVLMEIGRILISHVAPLLMIPYIVEDKLIPFMHSLCESESVIKTQVRPSARVIPKSIGHSNNRKLNSFLEIMITFTEKNELQAWASTLLSSLALKFHHTEPSGLGFPHQRNAIVVLNNLIRHKNFRHFLMNYVLFEDMRLPWFMRVKVSPFKGNSLWEMEPSVKINNRAFVATVNRICTAVNSLEEAQNEVLLSLMDNTDGSPTEPSSRRIFLTKLRSVRRQFYALNRVSPFRSPGSPLGLLRPFLLRLAHVAEILWTHEVNVVAPTLLSPSKFYDGSISYYDMDRLGGVLLYLLKTFPTELQPNSDVSQPTQMQGAAVNSTVVESSGTVYYYLDTLFSPDKMSRILWFVQASTSRGASRPQELASVDIPISDIFEEIAQLGTWTNQQTLLGNNADDLHESTGPVDDDSFFTELLDTLVLFYDISAKTSLSNDSISSFEEEAKDLVAAINEIKNAMPFLSQSSDKQHLNTLKAVELSLNVLLGHLNDVTERATTFHALRYVKRNLWISELTLNTMKAASDDVRLFHFVPEFYLDSLVEMIKQCSIESKSTIVPFETTADQERVLQDALQFLCDHINDERVRIAKAKDTMLSTMLDIVMTPHLLEALHHIPAASQLNMIRFLLQPYENRAWANSNWILVRIWFGSPNAFGCSRDWSKLHECKLRVKPLSNQINPPCFENDPYPSPVLQELVQTLLMNEPEVATSFINSVLNQLNWAFSEFIGMLQELQNVSNRRERIFVESRHLKICATCFDLALALLRVLEMIATLALPVFIRLNQADSNFLLPRLCQLVCQVLNRISSQDGCFHHIKSLEIPGLENIDHFPILSAVCGILLAILKDDLHNFDNFKTKVPKATETLLTEPSFQMSSFTFLTEKNFQVFSLNYYKDFITPEELVEVERILTMLIHYHRIITDTKTASNDVDEEELCTICFAYPFATVFEPCKHHSCRACIIQHLMNCKECFFCKTEITKVVDNDGKIIYDMEQQDRLQQIL